ncbi:abcG14 [Acrasis kona]|uniref:AbcG14 n=1 Tax=Acrasis kona TaxID=1008807 RepID=A0AAW2ZQ02_9EUKA
MRRFMLGVLFLTYCIDISRCGMVKLGFGDHKNFAFEQCTDINDGHPCYTRLELIAPKWTTTANEPNHIYSTYIPEGIGGDLCNNSVTRRLEMMNFKCEEYFCPGQDNVINRQFVNATLHTIIDDNKPNGDIEALLIARHNLLRNYCFHCSHSSRTSFHQNLTTSPEQCPYFWRHQSDHCGAVKAITLLDYNMVRVGKFKSWAMSQDSSLNSSLSLSRFSDILILTAWRSQRLNVVSNEVGRGEFSYLCYCTDSKRFGMQCDAYTSFFIPFSYLADPFIIIFLRSVVVFILLWFVYIPILYNDKKYLKKGFIKLFRAHFLNIKTIATIYITIGEFIGIFDEVLTLNLDSSPKLSTFYTVFTGVQYVLTGLSFVSLLILWIDMVEKAKNLSTKNALDIKLKIVLLLLYVLVVFVVILIVVTFTVTNQLVSMVIDCFLIAFLSFIFISVSIGFIIYGSLIFKTIFKNSSKIKPWDLKFMRFVFIGMIAFTNFSAWLIVSSVRVITGNLMGLFIRLFTFHICVWCISILCLVVTFLLFDGNKFFSLKINMFMFCKDNSHGLSSTSTTDDTSNKSPTSNEIVLTPVSTTNEPTSSFFDDKQEGTPVPQEAI